VKTARLKDKVTIAQWETLCNIWNGTMFVDLDWPLNASSPLSASAELLVKAVMTGGVSRILFFAACRPILNKISYRKQIARQHSWSTE